MATRAACLLATDLMEISDVPDALKIKEVREHIFNKLVEDFTPIFADALQTFKEAGYAECEDADEYFFIGFSNRVYDFTVGVIFADDVSYIEDLVDLFTDAFETALEDDSVDTKPARAV